MRAMLAVVLFIALTALCWGIYGPVLHKGQEGMGAQATVGQTVQPSRWRPFACVGLAYFAIAVVVPVAVLATRGETGRWTSAGTIFSLGAGAAGALGALGIILAFNYGGSPIYVMPLVFGCAPVVNTFLTMYLQKTYKEAGPVFISGLILVVAGAVAVLLFKPSTGGSQAAAAWKIVEAGDGKLVVEVPGETQRRTFRVHSQTKIVLDANSAALGDLKPGYLVEVQMQPDNNEQAAEITATAKAGKGTVRAIFDFWLVTLSIALTALSWGVYGPVLHKGQAAMGGSRLRPFLCVGIAYFLIAVLVPAVILVQAGEPGQWTVGGTMWSLLGGAAGAVGALGIILAFTYGGKPVYVMPLVFGGAPVVNTLTSLGGELMAGRTLHTINPLFFAGLILVGIGAVVVLVFAPKGGKISSHAAPAMEKKAPAEAAAAS